MLSATVAQLRRMVKGKPVVSCVLASLTLGASLILLWHQYGLDGPLVLPMATLSGLLSQPIEAAEAIHDLLDTEMLVRTPGRSLVNQKAVHFGPFSMTVPEEDPVAGETWTMTVQCDDAIRGRSECPSSYFVHLRGPTLVTISPRMEIYHHDADNGRTEIPITIPQAGQYEVWVWPEWANTGECPADQGETFGHRPAVRGSGETIVKVSPGKPVVDHVKDCTSGEYESDLPGRWVSIAHINPRYQDAPWVQSHITRSTYGSPLADSLHGGIPDYIYLPYRCKRPALDYSLLVGEIKSMRHVVYIGDSILRTTFCSHLQSELLGGISGDCMYSDDLKGYHLSAKGFTYDLPPDDPRGHVRFSQRFIAQDINAVKEIDGLHDYAEPVTHVIVNVGMWYGYDTPDEYASNVNIVLEQLLESFGQHVSITWLHSVSVSPPIFCYDFIKRLHLRQQGDYAKMTINAFRDRHPTVNVREVDTFPIVDARPETSSDGRHWVQEGDLPDLAERPMVGRADHAVMEIVYGAWLEDDLDRFRWGSISV
ncbi:hypothetical protein JCM24511_06096 [Saitozyma sp. JCM 24511]|nr:hypothetical protein JCM24511_06096 [Saitozyma sp. JCM 24511]